MIIAVSDAVTKRHEAGKSAEREPRGQKPRTDFSLRDLFDLLQLPNAPALSTIRFQSMQFKQGQRIHTIGQPLDALYVVNAGFLKTVRTDDLGNEQVLDFPMKGDMFGIDGIHHRRYETESVALSHCDIVLVPFSVLTSLASTHPEVEPLFYSALSREFLRRQAVIANLGSVCAERRVALFLVAQSDRLMKLGYSGSHLNLYMTRREISLHLGLAHGTVSRTFTALVNMGLISVDKRSIVIHDRQALRMLRRLAPVRRLSGTR